MPIIDIALVIVGILALFDGWRQGAISSIISAIGAIAGLLIGAAIAPFAMVWTHSTILRFLTALVVVVVLVTIGNLLGGLAGGQVRRSLPLRGVRTLDSAIGAIFQVITVLLVAWLVAIPLRTPATPQVASAIERSRILAAVSGLTPPLLGRVPSKITDVLHESGVPNIVRPEDSAASTPVAPPDAEINVENKAMVDKSRPGIVHVLGDAYQCQSRLSGSGFVVAPDTVMTNAHVVAGAAVVHLDTVLGVKEATVTYFDPANDIALLRSPDLDLQTIEFASKPINAGDDAVVAGFPRSGPFEADPARIRSRMTISSPNIYSDAQVDREAYVLLSNVRQGNSGGPLLNSEGKALGMVFGADANDAGTGYALTAQEIQKHVADPGQYTKKVDTKACVPD